eukprot:m.7137 g.7137  ORF g.7137 m.7137 type:complete len:560 (+) comp2714_c0_seq1:35-1714(+)
MTSSMFAFLTVCHVDNDHQLKKRKFRFSLVDVKAFDESVCSFFKITNPRWRYTDGEDLNIMDEEDAMQLISLAEFHMQHFGTCMVVQVKDEEDGTKWIDLVQAPNGNVIPLKVKINGGKSWQGGQRRNDNKDDDDDEEEDEDEGGNVHSEAHIFDLDEQLRRLDRGLELEHPSLSMELKETNGTTVNGMSTLKEDEEDDIDNKLFSQSVALAEEDNEDNLPHDCIWWLRAGHPISRFFETTTMLIILISIISFCIETIPKFRLDMDGKERTESHPHFFAVESFCIAWFTIEYSMRFYAADHRFRHWIWQPLNLVDIIAILPYYIAFFVSSSSASSLAVIRILRLTRVTRLFKISRHSSGLRDMIASIAGARKQLVLFFLIISVAMVLFGAAVFYCEKDEPDTAFISIPAGFWWAVVTLTTVGYGDVSPVTIQGQIVGGLAASFGVVLVAIPAGIFISEFMRIHEEKQLASEPDLNHEKAFVDIQAAVSELTKSLDKYRIARQMYDSSIKDEVVKIVNIKNAWDAVTPRLERGMQLRKDGAHAFQKKHRRVFGKVHFVSA